MDYGALISAAVLYFLLLLHIIALDRRHKKRLLSSVPLIRNSNLRVLLRRIHGGRGGYKELADAGYGEEEEEEERGRFVRGEHHDDDDDEESRLKKQLNELEGVMEYKDAHEAEKAQIAELENAIRETDDGDQREALIHKLHELKNAGAEYRQQKTHRRERATPSKQQTEEEIRTSRGVLPSYDPFSKMFEQHKQQVITRRITSISSCFSVVSQNGEQAARDDEIDDEDAQTEGLTDIEADPSLIRREWNVPDEPLPPPDEPPSDEGEDALGAPTTALEKLQEEMEKEEEEEFEKSSSNYAGPLSFRPLPKQQPYEAPDFATILNAPEYTGKRRRGGKQVRMKELHTRKSQRFQEKNRAKSDARKQQIIESI
eukprot:jgi/Bigna1/79512/fgenesh1_pg.63_\